MAAEAEGKGEGKERAAIDITDMCELPKNNILNKKRKLWHLSIFLFLRKI